MKKLKLALATVFLSAVMAGTSLAGTWTHSYTYSDGETVTYDYLWFYIKDDGTYACQEWIQDTDGTRYWLDSTSLPTSPGVADDGSLYDDGGRYVPMEGRAYLTFENATSISMGMTYDQVVAVLGLEHARPDGFFRSIYGTDYIECVWVAQDNHGKLTLDFTNGVVTGYSTYWY